MVLTWRQLEKLVKFQAPDLINGSTSAQATLRLFGNPESCVRVTLFRDHHAWCPYCQKIWLWLEEKQIPYRIRKVTMFCYGQKEAWYKKLVPSGMLPALELDGKIITESDVILARLEKEFGPLGPTKLEQIGMLRKLERALFSSWCRWLCYPCYDVNEENASKAEFVKVAKYVDQVLEQRPEGGPFFLGQFSTADVIFVPYVERMNASLFYYKGFLLRDPEQFPHLSAWFDGLETRPTYLGTQSDFHTHCHDLPPQMGGCYPSPGPDPAQAQCQSRVDSCTDFELPETKISEPETSRQVALARVLKHKESILKVNPVQDEGFDESLRAALTLLMTGEKVDVLIPHGAEVGLRYLRDRINVPRDMPIWSARRLREALENVAQLSASQAQGPAIPQDHRRDQDPKNFGK